MFHELKSWPRFFKPVRSGLKTFEVRNNDRNFKQNETLVLREYDPEAVRYTGRKLGATIKYVLAEHEGLQPGHVVLGLKDIHEVTT